MSHDGFRHHGTAVLDAHEIAYAESDEIEALGTLHNDHECPACGAPLVSGQSAAMVCWSCRSVTGGERR